MAENRDKSGIGVYLVTNTVNGKVYVGSTTQGFRTRWHQHKSKLRNGGYGTRHFQMAWDHYGESAFTWSVLEKCTVEECIPREQYWIDYYRSSDRSFGYNAVPTAGNQLGMKHTDESKKRISQGLKGRSTSPETRERLSLAHRGRPKRPEQVERLRQLLTGRKLRPEHVQKVADANRGRKRTPEFCERMRQMRLAYWSQPGNKEKQRERLRINGHAMSQETIRKAQNRNRGSKASDATRSKMRQAHSGRNKRNKELIEAAMMNGAA